MRCFSPGAVATIALWKSAPVLRTVTNITRRRCGLPGIVILAPFTLVVTYLFKRISY